MSSSTLPSRNEQAERVLIDRAIAAVHDYLYVGDVSRDQVRAVICDTFTGLRERGVPAEQSLAQLKVIIRHIRAGGSLRPLDEEGPHWLTDNLVRWVIGCYYPGPR